MFLADWMTYEQNRCIGVTHTEEEEEEEEEEKKCQGAAASTWDCMPESFSMDFNILNSLPSSFTATNYCSCFFGDPDP